jgi:ribulose-phosphate 3-epimerase
MSEIIPTIVPKTAAEIRSFVERFGALAPVLHLDMTDGDFAFPTTWTPGPEDELPSTCLWEVHLMANAPRPAGEAFIRAGAWRVIGHAEMLAGEDGVNTLRGWRAMGAREVGIALKLGSPLSMIEHLAPHADVLHLMSIRKIGAQGESFDPAVLPKIREARERYPHLVISVDGGLHQENIADVVRAGATRLCIGAALAHAEDAASAYAQLKLLAQSAIQ